MVGLLIATPAALLVVRRGQAWSVEEHQQQSPTCLAVDPHDPGTVYCGTSGGGLLQSVDAGRTWEPSGSGIEHATVTAVAVAGRRDSNEPTSVYAGTEPSAIFRSDDGGNTWAELTGLRALPSASTWSFPPRPQTHHVRWIESDVTNPDRLFVAIEAGALVRTVDGGRTWQDRVHGGPYDTHTAATHPMAPGRFYSAAGDGYYESSDAGTSWASPDEGLRHGYLVGLAVDPADADTVVVSAAEGPFVAYRPAHAETYVYRRAGPGQWALAMEGLPRPAGTTVNRFATHPGEPAVFYAANNHGVFRSDNGGRSWKALDIPWPQRALVNGIEAIACLPER